MRSFLGPASEEEIDNVSGNNDVQGVLEYNKKQAKLKLDQKYFSTEREETEASEKHFDSGMDFQKLCVTRVLARMISK